MILYDNISDAQITTDATRRTADGYLAASARVARTGIQVYTGRECGRPDLEFVRVYRPESEVFKQDAIKTFAHRPITDDHPHTQVTADNWKSLSKGHTGEEIVRDGRFIRVPMLLMDGPTIKKWEDGKRELSMGYSCDLEWKDGITEDGDEYDAIQTNIKANHLALVKKARGGEDLHIGDTGSHKKGSGDPWHGTSGPSGSGSGPVPGERWMTIGKGPKAKQAFLIASSPEEIQAQKKLKSVVENYMKTETEGEDEPEFEFKETKNYKGLMINTGGSFPLHAEWRAKTWKKLAEAVEEEPEGNFDEFDEPDEPKQKWNPISDPEELGRKIGGLAKGGGRLEKEADDLEEKYWKLNENPNADPKDLENAFEEWQKKSREIRKKRKKDSLGHFGDFNPNHDPQTGRFTFSTKQEAEEWLTGQRAKLKKAKVLRREETVGEVPSGVLSWLKGAKAKKKVTYEISRDGSSIIVDEALLDDLEEALDSADNVHAADDLDNVDNNTGEPTMRIMVDGISLEMADKDAQIVKRALDEFAAKVEMMTEEEKKRMEAEAKAKKKYETDAAALTTQVATLTTENTQLKKQVADAALTPAKLDQLVKDRSITIDKAKAILGNDKVDAKLTDAEIRRACVNHVVGDAAKDWSDDLVNASFATIKVGVSDGVRKLANSFDHQPQPKNTTVLDTAYGKYEENLRKASQAAAA